MTSVPGPSAAIVALTLAGLPTDRFLFAGFLPARDKARRAVQCAGDDPHLATAVQIVRQLIERQSPE